MPQKSFLCSYGVEIPYPKTIAKRIEASGIGTALARGWRQARKELKGKKIKTITAKITTL